MLDEVCEQVRTMLPELQIKYDHVDFVGSLVSQAFRLAALYGNIQKQVAHVIKGDVILAAYLALLKRESGPELALLSNVIDMARIIDPDRHARIIWLAGLWSQFSSLGSSVSALSECTKAALLLYAKVGAFALVLPDLPLDDLPLEERSDLILSHVLRSGLARINAETGDLQQTQTEVLDFILIEDQDRRKRLSTPHEWCLLGPLARACVSVA